jgi:ectoine hydroxylase-related dioxygenase (phytanoyl-CoA dioxygenase family)
MEMLRRNDKEEFDSQGFLVFDPGIDASVIDTAYNDLIGLYPPEGTPDDNMGGKVAMRNARRIQDAWRISPAVKTIATAPRILEVLRGLYGRKPLPFQTLNFKVGSEQRTHSDTVHFNSRPAGLMCGVWVALEDVDMDNGPVMYYPGSHKWEEIALPEVDAFQARGRLAKALAPFNTRFRYVRDTNADYQVYENVIQDRIDRAGAKPVYATIRKGEAFIWAANLLHGGSHQRDRSRTRMSQVTHYFFEGCRYYTPLLQRGPITRWRKPEWIV